MTNLERKTRRLRNALREIYGDEPPETLVTDALADMRHLCDADGVSYSAADRMAQSHYLTEKNTQVRFQFEDA
jgi:hypothetical protein